MSRIKYMDHEGKVFVSRWILWIILLMFICIILLSIKMIAVTMYLVIMVFIGFLAPVFIFLRAEAYDGLKIWGNLILGRRTNEN